MNVPVRFENRRNATGCRLPSGIDSLDDLVGGGLVLGSRVYLVGPQDAGKTALAVQIADSYARQGTPVGILTADDNRSEIITRLLQRRGISRAECEQGAPKARTGVRALAGLPMRLFDSWIEYAERDLLRFAAGRPAVLIVDSLQTATTAGEDADVSFCQSLKRRAAAITVAAARGLLVIVTSDEPITYRPSAAERRIPERSADLLLEQKPVSGSPDLIELAIAKSMHRTTAGKRCTVLQFDRDRQDLFDVADVVGRLW